LKTNADEDSLQNKVLAHLQNEAEQSRGQQKLAAVLPTLFTTNTKSSLTIYQICICNKKITI